MSVVMPAPTARWWALGVLAMTQLVVVLDATIVNVALPRAQAELALTDGQRQWVITAYVLAFGALLLLGGRIADYWGRRRTYVIGMIGFGLASLWGGLAQSGIELILARGVQGAFAALLAPAALSLLTVTFPTGRERGIAFAVFGTVAGIGGAVGLALGGVLTEFAGWRWCLLVNLFFAAVGIVGAVLYLRESRAEGENRYDIAGAVTVTLGLGSLVYGFTQAESGWAAPATIGFLALGVALLLAFVWVESRVAQPLVPLTIFRDRTRVGAFLIQAIAGAVYLATTMFIAFHLQLVLGLTPLLAGAGSLAMTGATLLVVPFAMRVFRRLGGRVVMTIGPLVVAGGMVWLSRLTIDGTYWTDAFPGLLLIGIGMAFIVVPVQNVALTGILPHDAGAASAVVTSAMQIGGSIALALFTSLFIAVGGSHGAGEAAPVLPAYSAVYLATAGLLVIAAVISLTMVRRPAETDAAADVPVHAG